jgi:hypothetical protein
MTEGSMNMYLMNSMNNVHFVKNKSISLIQNLKLHTIKK